MTFIWTHEANTLGSDYQVQYGKNGPRYHVRAYTSIPEDTKFYVWKDAATRAREFRRKEEAEDYIYALTAQSPEFKWPRYDVTVHHGLSAKPPVAIESYWTSSKAEAAYNRLRKQYPAPGKVSIRRVDWEEYSAESSATHN